jgi:D-alanyl-D-alanine carboxypeptidase/D-alanyl-D-alanine-endopeptidase (penicillin-binding protein 4)
MGELTLEERGLARVNAWLLSIGARQGDAVMFDGCGLSRKNAISPHALNVVLRHMCGPTGDGPYIDLMKHEGEGNAKTFRYKTGAMDSVRSITGIVKTSTGQPMAVTAIVNDHTPSIGELRASLNALINQLQALGTVKLKPLPAPAHVAATHAPTPARAHRHRRHRHRHR